jgi:hypothetical protein
MIFTNADRKFNAKYFYAPQVPINEIIGELEFKLN